MTAIAVHKSQYEAYKVQLVRMIRAGVVLLSDIKPADWAEANLIMPKPFPGPWRYDRTPYTREIINRLAPNDPARVIAVMKGAQLGFSSGVIYPGVGWIIQHAPGNIYLTVGKPLLIEPAMAKVDAMLTNSGLRAAGYIQSTTLRVRAQKSGDTNNRKEFVNGSFTLSTVNDHGNVRQVDLEYVFLDDLESAKKSSKESGDTVSLITQRCAAYADSYKMFLISTPEQKSTSNIEPAYLLGDQRKYMVRCPHCKDFIELVWNYEKDGKKGGITWQMDAENQLIEGSVGYICQECSAFFDDKEKHSLLNSGYWKPTARPSKPGYYSYHISALYAPIGMFDWEHYVYQYLEANPVGQPRDEKKHQTFVNVCLGETYESTAEAPKASTIMGNVCKNPHYEILSVPEKVSLVHGNGNIVLLTCAADMNGLIDDCRLDYEIVAWSAAGPSYSVMQGSLGTFIPRENTLKVKEDRKKWTYEEGKENSIWPEFDKILATVYLTDTDTPRQMKILQAGTDTGGYKNFWKYAYAYIDRSKITVGLKGDKENAYRKHGLDTKMFKPAKERKDLYIIEVGLYKDQLAANMGLRWPSKDVMQPNGFMNFPQPSKGAYSYTNYFEHFESEHCQTVNDEDGNPTMKRWVKKTQTAQNHFWDCRIYNLVLRDIVVDMVGKSLKKPAYAWSDFAALMSPKK